MLVSCTDSQTFGDQAAPSTDGDVPDFSGPWAAEFHQAYLNAPNDEVRSYLEDERISDAEMQAVTDVFRTCLDAQGATFTNFDPDGGFSFNFGDNLNADTANQIADACSQSSGVDAVNYLYFQMRSNPENHDLSAAVVACLLRSGVVPSDYTVEQYRAAPITDVALGDKNTAIDAVQRCESDPHGAFGG